MFLFKKMYFLVCAVTVCRLLSRICLVDYNGTVVHYYIDTHDALHRTTIPVILPPSTILCVHNLYRVPGTAPLPPHVLISTNHWSSEGLSCKRPASLGRSWCGLGTREQRGGCSTPPRLSVPFHLGTTVSPSTRGAVCLLSATHRHTQTTTACLQISMHLLPGTGKDKEEAWKSCLLLNALCFGLSLFHTHTLIRNLIIILCEIGKIRC